MHSLRYVQYIIINYEKDISENIYNSVCRTREFLNFFFEKTPHRSKKLILYVHYNSFHSIPSNRFVKSKQFIHEHSRNVVQQTHHILGINIF